MHDTPSRWSEVRALATARCGDCGWYHGTWPLLRALGLGSSPHDHVAAYARGLEGLAPRRVLVTGAADPAMLEVVIAVVGDVVEEVILVDRCATPLALGQAWAQRAGVALRTVERDARTLHDLGPVDAVVTHAFLGYFDAPGRRDLLAAWAGALRPGGRVVTVNRLRPGAPDHPVRASEAETEALVARVVAGAREAGLDVVAAAAAARAWAERMVTWPLQSAAALEAQLVAVGLEPALTVREGVSPSAAPGTGARASVVEVVAVRP